MGLLSCSYPQLVWRGLDVLATTVQNNPVCQEYCLKEGMVGKFMQLMGPSFDAQVRVKALYALSGMIWRGSCLSRFCACVRACGCHRVRAKALYACGWRGWAPFCACVPVYVGAA